MVYMARSSAHHIVAFCVIGFLIGTQASEFLAQPDAEAIAAANALIERALVEQIEAALGDHSSDMQGRINSIRNVLSPIYKTLPSNSEGRLDHGVVRYVLHRFMSEHHGWFIRGIEPDGQQWNSSDKTGVLADHMPEDVQDIFERRLHGHGMNLDDLTMLAATLEHLVRNETTDRLEKVYRNQELAVNDKVTMEQANLIFRTYLTVYILGASAVPLDSRERMASTTQELYEKWPDAANFVVNTVNEVSPQTADMTFADVLKVISTMGDRFGRWQDKECRDITGKLSKTPLASVGRIRLGDFYSLALHGGEWEFSESVEYLRSLGALDESDPQDLKLIIANYVNSPSNCLVPSSYHSICCLDPCEGILSHLERELKVPAAQPAKIAPLVAALPSASRPANATLSETLMNRLNEVAEHHGGLVPLHGRLFSQWLHLAYPVECRFPHVSGSTKPEISDKWSERTGLPHLATREQMQRYIVQPSTEIQEELDDSSPMWTMDEELLTDFKAVRGYNFGFLLSLIRMVVALALLVSMILTIARFMPRKVHLPHKQKSHIV